MAAAFVNGVGWRVGGSEAQICRPPRGSRAARFAVEDLRPGYLNEIGSVADFDELMEAGGRLWHRTSYNRENSDFEVSPLRYRKISLEYKDSWFGKVDINSVGKLPRRQGIKEMPTFQIFKNGEKLGEIIGSLKTDEVDNALRQYFVEHVG